MAEKLQGTTRRADDSLSSFPTSYCHCYLPSPPLLHPLYASIHPLKPEPSTVDLGGAKPLMKSFCFFLNLHVESNEERDSHISWKELNAFGAQLLQS